MRKEGKKWERQQKTKQTIELRGRRETVDYYVDRNKGMKRMNGRRSCCRRCWRRVSRSKEKKKEQKEIAL